MCWKALDYQLLRRLPFLQRPYEDRFATRGWHFYGGIAQDRERFGFIPGSSEPVAIKAHDSFWGTSLKGLGRFDITGQQTRFASAVRGDPAQANSAQSQRRTDIVLLYRILDEEIQPGIPKQKMPGGLHPAFLHLVIPYRRDSALTGPQDFENRQIGVGLDAKFFRRGFHTGNLNSEAQRFEGTTFLVSLRYAHQRFPRLDKSVNQFGLSVSMGF